MMKMLIDDRDDNDDGAGYDDDCDDERENRSG